MIDEPISISQFARNLGVSFAAVKRAIEVGRIPSAAVGTRDLGSGRTVPAIVDEAAARAGFLGELPRQAASSAPAPSMCASHVPPLAVSRARKEAALAGLRELEVEQAAGRLVNAEEFRLKFSQMVVQARTRLLGIPSKMKGRIPHLTVDEAEIVKQLIRESLEEISDATN